MGRARIGERVTHKPRSEDRQTRGREGDGACHSRRKGVCKGPAVGGDTQVGGTLEKGETGPESARGSQ